MNNQRAVPAGVPAVELSRIIDYMIDEARREKAQYASSKHDFTKGFYDGEIFALKKLRETVCSKPLTAGTGGNGKVCDR